MNRTYDTLVIGAGQAGLAAGYYLQRAGLRFTLLDAGEEIGLAWKNRWDSLRLFTPARYNALPGMPFPGERYALPTKDEVAQYLEAYAQRFQLPVRLRSRDVEYRYRQDSDFWYLTGFAEPDAVAVLVPGRAGGQYVLFCRERDPEKELWDGSRAGPAGAVADHGADDAFPIDDIDDIIPGLIESCSRVYYTMGVYTDFDARIAEWINSLR